MIIHVYHGNLFIDGDCPSECSWVGPFWSLQTHIISVFHKGFRAFFANFRSEWVVKFNSHFFGHLAPCKLFKNMSHRTIISDIQEMFVVFWCNTSSSGNNCDVIFTGEEDSTNRTKARSLTPEHVLVKRLQIVSRQLRKAFAWWYC